MAEKIKYLLNILDTAKPVYEVNYTKHTWKIVSYGNRRYGDNFLSGKFKDETGFTSHHFEEVEKPVQRKELRVVA